MSRYSDHGLVGREKELTILKHALDEASAGKGSTVMVSGEAGIGKTRLIAEFKEYAGKKVKILYGAATSDSLEPFLIFSRAFEDKVDRPLFHDQEYTSFATIFAVDRAGLLLAQASSQDDELDADIFAAMLSAVQDFVRDSFDTDGTRQRGLGKLEYGDMKIMIEHGEHMFLTAVLRGAEHKDMRSMLKNTVQNIERDHSHALKTWKGNVSNIRGVQDEISSLAGAKFLVRRELEGNMLENERIRIADQALNIIMDMARDKPLLVLLEDLHWADESSLFVLNYMARNIKNERVMLLGSLRPKESNILIDRLDKMREEEIITELDLKMFSADDVRSLAYEIYGDNNLPEDFIDSLTSQCKGNPFFTIELLKQMEEEGNIGDKDGRYVLLSEDYSIPSSVEDIVYRKLDKLDSDAMTLVEYASCIGLQFGREVAGSIQAIKDISPALDRLTGNGILILSNGKIEFSHAIFQEVIYKSIGDRWHSLYHKNLGEYYEYAFRGNPAEVLYELARHFSRSKEYIKAFDYCMRAGEKAESEFAPEQSIELYKWALSVYDRMRKPDARNERIVLLEKMGDIQTLIGEWSDALVRFIDGSELTEEPEVKARLLRKAGEVHFKKGEYDKAQECFERALHQVSASEEEREAGRIHGSISEVYLRLGNFEKAQEHFQLNLKIAEETSEKKEMGDAYNRMGIIYWMLGDLAGSTSCFQKSLDMRREIGDLMSISSSLNNLGNLYYTRGQWDAAINLYNESREIREKIGDIQGMSASYNNLGNLYGDRGRFEEAIEYHEMSLKIKERIGDPVGASWSYNNIGNILKKRNQPEKALDNHLKALELRENANDNQGVVGTLIDIALVYVMMGQIDKAVEACERSECLMEGSEDILHKAMLLRARGNIQCSLLNWDLAEENFLDSLKILEEIDCPLDLAKIRRDYGLLLKETEKYDRAIEQLEISLGIFEKLDAIYIIKDIEALLDELKNMPVNDN